MTPKDEGLMNAYLSHLEASGRRGLSSVRGHLKAFTRWLEDRGLELGEVSQQQAQEFQSSLVLMETPEGKTKYAAVTVGGIVRLSGGFYQWMVSRGLVGHNPFRWIQKVKTESKLPRYVPSQEELMGYLKELREFWKEPAMVKRRRLYKVHVIAEVMYATGMRISEAAAICETDIDWQGNTIKVRDGKGGVERVVYLNEYSREILRIYVGEGRQLEVKQPETNALFGAKSSTILCAFMNAHLRKQNGFSSHGLRHCLGTHLLQRGCDLRFIQLILGHEDLGSTTVYTRVNKEDLKHQLDLYHPRR